MRTDYTNLRTTVQDMLASITEAMNKSIALTNQRRVELITAYNGLAEATHDLAELGNILGEAADAFTGMSETALDVASKAAEVLDAAEDVPSCNFEDFVGFCDLCGGAVSSKTEHYNEKGYLYCAECTERETAEESYTIVE